MRLVTARIVEVVMISDVKSVSLLDVGAGSPPDTTPGHCIWPADAETARISIRIATAHWLRKVFTLGSSWRECKNFALLNRTAFNFSCKTGEECVRFARGFLKISNPCDHCEEHHSHDLTGLTLA